MVTEEVFFLKQCCCVDMMKVVYGLATAKVVIMVKFVTSLYSGPPFTTAPNNDWSVKM